MFTFKWLDTVIPLCIMPVSRRVLNSISSKLCHQNTQFNMYTITSKQQEGSTCKDTYPKCFIMTNFDKFHHEGAINRGEIFRACFHHFPLCFLFNFYTSIKLIMSFFAHVPLKHFNRTKFLFILRFFLQNIHPKCFKATNFDRFHEEMSLLHVY